MILYLALMTTTPPFITHRIFYHAIIAGQRFALDGHDVGVIARSDRAQALIHAGQRRAVCGRGSERLGRRHTDIDEPAKLTRILAEHRAIYPQKIFARIQVLDGGSRLLR
jgi:hypothetical protein